MIEVWFFISGYLLQFFGSALLFWQIWRKKSIYGLSSDTQICLLCSTIARCAWSVDTRLVQTWMAYAELIASTSIATLICVLVYRYRHTTIKQAWWPLRSFVLLPLAAALAFVYTFHQEAVTKQVLVAFTMFLEAVALAPQLQLMMTMVEIEPLTGHYVAFLVISRVVRLLFWASLLVQGDRFVALLAADLVHTVLAADYLYVWCKRLRHGGVLIYRV